MTATLSGVQAALVKADRSTARRLAGTADLRAAVSLVLAAGGDLRIWPDPTSGRNRYGTRTIPAPDEISFSSTTASNVSEEGFDAAEHVLARILGTSETLTTLDQWFDDIRACITNHLGLPGSETILAASGTDAELLALGIAVGLAQRPITNIFMAPDETGNGIPLAAAGRHFSDLTALGETVVSGQPIEGLFPGHIEVRAIAIRDETGKPRDPATIDNDVAIAVERELRRGRDVLLHVLDASKTGMIGPTRRTARSLAASAGGRVHVVIDACQLRCSFVQLKSDLVDGFMVTVTGSKFAAGPPFAGALLLPKSIAEEVASRVELPAGLSHYTAALDWPSALSHRLRLQWKSEANIGLGLRWVAALINIASCASVDERRRTLIIDYFDQQVRARAAEARGLMLHADDAAEHLGSRSIVPLTVLASDENYAGLNDAQRVQAALRDPLYGPVCHIGQVVRVGPRSVLRIGASARDISGVAERMAAGLSLERAFQPVAADLDTLFAKWSAIICHPEAG